MKNEKCHVTRGRGPAGGPRHYHVSNFEHEPRLGPNSGHNQIYLIIIVIKY